jgi:hypothetical protein
MLSSAVYDLLGEREFYPFALHKTVIPAKLVPAKAGIHRGEHSAPPTGGDLPGHV